MLRMSYSDHFLSVHPLTLSNNNSKTIEVIFPNLVRKSKCKFTPHLKAWKLKDPQMSSHFNKVFNLHMSTSTCLADGATEDIWNSIKTGLLKTTEEVCGTTRPQRWRCETLWWNEHLEKAIAANWKAFKAWKTGKGTRAGTQTTCLTNHQWKACPSQSPVI